MRCGGYLYDEKLNTIIDFWNFRGALAPTGYTVASPLAAAAKEIRLCIFLRVCLVTLHLEIARTWMMIVRKGTFDVVPSRLTTRDSLVPLHRLFQSGTNTLIFLYAMPMSSTRVFFEVGTEISLRSYIPVGGSLPNTDQKNLAFGAAASIVHPATGTKRFINFLHASFLLAYIDDVSQNT
jgi:hypothetical protein